jgi:hypothetical protein
MRRLRMVALTLIALTLIVPIVCLAQAGRAQNESDASIRVAASIIAGSEQVISTTGSGQATFYLLGPGVSRKTDVNLGEEIRLNPGDVRNAGDYQVILCSNTCKNAKFYVRAAQPTSLTFLVHPSRVPVSQDNAVSGVALPFDQFHNLVFDPVAVDFRLTAGDTSVLSRTVRTQNGVAWFRTTSGKSAGAVQVIADLESVSVRRVVQQVASDPCNLRITGQRTSAGILVQTEPVHDCSGNSVPDGTIVTFTATEASGKSTVDAPIKQGIARAQMTITDAAVVSAASGVVMGNEIRVQGRP